jgi:hypothetical protein
MATFVVIVEHPHELYPAAKIVGPWEGTLLQTP